MAVTTRIKLPFLRFDGKSLGPRVSCAQRLIAHAIGPAVRSIIREELRQRDEKLRRVVLADGPATEAHVRAARMVR